VEAADRGEWQVALGRTEQAIQRDPSFNLYQFQLGVAAANAGQPDRARVAFEQSAARDDYRYAWLNLAALRWQAGDPDGAREALTRAERLGTQQTAIAFAAGWLRQQLGDTHLATADYAIAITQMPTLAGDPFWTSPEGPAGGLEAILASVRERAGPTTMLQVHLVLGEFEAAQSIAGGLSANDPILYQFLVPAWSGDPGAWQGLQDLARSRPRDSGPASWARLVAAYRGDTEAVRGYGVWLAITNSPDYLQPPIGRIRLDEEAPLAPNFLDAYGTLYRRQIPKVQVVGGLPQIVSEETP
jgi:tetratricopeptide (TPR) repeat protein